MYSRPQLQAATAASDVVAPMHVDDLRCSRVAEDLKRTSGCPRRLGAYRYTAKSAAEPMIVQVE